MQDVVKGLDPTTIKGVGFDATCSLAAFDQNGDPLSVSPSGKMLLL